MKFEFKKINRSGSKLKMVTGVITAFFFGAQVFAQGTPAELKIGVLTDLSSAYSDLTGKGSVAAVEMAVEDFGGVVLGRKIKVISADHQLKPEIGTAIASRWFDTEAVQAIFDLTGSSVALAVQTVGKSHPDRALFYGVPITSDLVKSKCLANTAKWMPDANSLTYPLVKTMSQQGSKKWFLLLQDTAVAPPMRDAALKGIADGGAKLVGEVKVPVNAGDVSSFVLQAQAAGADVIAVGTGGADLFNVHRTAKQFGLLQSGVKIVSFSMYSTDVDAMGQNDAQGMALMTPFFPGMNPKADAWAKRFKQRTGKMPAFSQANDYSSALSYLAAVRQAGTTNATEVMKVIKSAPVDNIVTTNGKVRADGQLIRPMYFVRVKPPAQSKYPGDYFDLVATIPGEEAFLPPSSECALVGSGKSQ